MPKIQSLDRFLSEMVNYETKYGKGNVEHPDPAINQVDAFVISEVKGSPISFNRIVWSSDVSWSTPFGLKMSISKEDSSISVKFYQESSESNMDRTVNGYTITGANPTDLISKMKRDMVFKSFVKSKKSAQISRPILVSKLKKSKLTPESFVEFIELLGPAKNNTNRDSYGPWARTGYSNYEFFYDLSLAIEKGWQITEKWLTDNKETIAKLAEWNSSSAYHSSKLKDFSYNPSTRILNVKIDKTHYYD